jgi:hypothetical protein
VRRDADHRPPRVVVDPDAFPDGILTWKRPIGHQLADDHDRRHVFSVARLERPAAQQRYLHRLEITGSHHGHFRGWAFAWLRFRHSFRQERGLPSGHEGRIGGEGGLLHTGEGREFRHQRLDKVRELYRIRITRLRKIDAGRKKEMRIETESEIPGVSKALYDQPRRAQEDQGQRHFGHHQQIARTAGARRIGAAASTCFESELNVSAGHLPGWPEAEQDAGDKR